MATPDIDEINKIRKAVGLPLLPSATGPQPEGPTFKDHSDSDQSDEEPASTLETREAAGYDNYRQKQEEDRRKVEREKRKQQLQKARDAAVRFTKLEGKGLGDLGDDGELDAKAWLKSSKKRQAKIDKERAEKLAAELAERERLAAIEYTSADLAGVQVAHEVGDFENGESEQILTLQDTQVGQDNDSEEGDVLENADMVARDKLKDKLDLKKKKNYDVHDETGEKSLLGQYDEKKRKAFTLDSQGITSQEREAKRQQIGDKLKATITLDVLKSEPVSDYLEVKIKKPKRSKKSSKRQRADDGDDDEVSSRPTAAAIDAMDLDEPKVAPSANPQRPQRPESTFNDDDDLASALSFSRRAALKKQKRKAQDIIKQLKEEEKEAITVTTELEGGITVDETTNFLDNLSNRPQDDEPRPRARKDMEEPDAPDPQPEDHDQVMGEAYGGVEDEAELLEKIQQSSKTAEVSHSGLGEEESLDQGLGATLNLLKKRGVVKETERTDRNSLYKARQGFMIEARLREHENEQRARAQRERDRQSGKLTNMSAKEREDHARWQNTQREHQSSIQAAAAFNRDYKPDVQIKYVDESGRLMNQKEAFKHLSHQFHGKGSGKQKTEKHLKKLEEEKKRMASSVLDSSKATGIHNAAGAQSKKNKEAGVRLA